MDPDVLYDLETLVTVKGTQCTLGELAVCRLIRVAAEPLEQGQGVRHLAELNILPGERSLSSWRVSPKTWNQILKILDA